jgi:hypothetical protein
MAGSVANARKANTSGANTTTTTSFTSTAGGTIWVGVSDGSGQGSLTISDNKGNTYSQIGTTRTSASGAQIRRFYCANILGGAGHTVTATWGSNSDATVHVLELAGVATASLDSAASAQADDNNPPWTVTSGTLAQADSIAIAMTGTAFNGTWSESSGFTVQTQEGDSNLYWTGCAASRVVAATTALTPSFTISGGGSDCAVAVDVFKASAGGTSYNLTVDPASYSLTAAAETVTATRALTIAPASYGLTAQAVNLAVGRALNISPASYTLSAAAVTMTATRTLNVSPASYALTAADVTLTYAPSLKELVVDPASYAVSAANVSFAVTRALSIDPASYSLTNSAETLSVGRVLSVNAASYALSASAQTLVVGRVLSVDPVAYSLTLADVTLDYRPSNPVLSVDPVSYTLSLPDVEFEYGRSGGGGYDDAKKKIRKRVNELNQKILQAEAQEITETAVTKANSVVKSAPTEQGFDEDEEEALMLLL